MIKEFKQNKKKRKAGRPKGSLGKKKVNLDTKVKNCSAEKIALIKKIWKLEPIFKILDIDLTKYTVEELEKHIRLFKKKGKK